MKIKVLVDKQNRSSELNRSGELLDLLNSKFAESLVDSKLELEDVVIRLDRAKVFEILSILKSELKFSFLVDITVVDWLDSKPDRFEVVYHLLSLQTFYRLRVKAWIPESDPQVASVAGLWAGANFMEREAWDMYGVVFKGHPDLRRILMYDEFKGHPLRKDYPIQGKQPRVKMLSPEVRNTAVDMQRPALVQIKSRAGSQQPQTSTSGQLMGSGKGL